MARPCLALLAGLGAAAAIWFGMGRLPLPVLVLLLLVAVVGIPLAGTSFVYSLIGADVIFDRGKQSATWQQGIIGLGIGTRELVPFWKIAAVAVEEAGAAAGSGQPVEEFAQWQIVLEKTSGKRLVVAGATTARSLEEDAYTRAVDVAGAISELTGAPLRLPVEPEPEPVAATRRSARRRARRRRR